jgi:hypothetical protein
LRASTDREESHPQIFGFFYEKAEFRSQNPESRIRKSRGQEKQNTEVRSQNSEGKRRRTAFTDFLFFCLLTPVF